MKNPIALTVCRSTESLESVSSESIGVKVLVHFGPESEGVEAAEQHHHHPPPEGWVQVGENGRARVPELVDALAEDDQSAGEHEDADEEPDGQRLLGTGIDVMGMRCFRSEERRVGKEC